MSSAPVHLILGAYGGIGTAVSRRLHAAGARLLLAGRNVDRLADLGAELGAPTFILDAREPTAVEEAAARAVNAPQGSIVKSLIFLADGAPLTRTKLRDALAVKNERLGEALQTLERTGKIRRSPTGWQAVD